MHSGSLTRLRAGFLLLAAALLGPLFFLLSSVEARLEAQRKLRHEIVAERIFDEMERELTELLAREGERPSSAYDATSTRVETWAPFVVGYFRRGPGGLHVIAREQLGSERVGRVEAAVASALPQVEEPSAAPPEGVLPVLPETETLGSGALRARGALEKDVRDKRAPKLSGKKELKSLGEGLGTAGPAQPSKADSESVLRQLNRGEYGKHKARVQDKGQSDDLSHESDPLEGL